MIYFRQHSQFPVSPELVCPDGLLAEDLLQTDQQTRSMKDPDTDCHLAEAILPHLHIYMQLRRRQMVVGKALFVGRTRDGHRTLAAVHVCTTNISISI